MSQVVWLAWEQRKQQMILFLNSRTFEHKYYHSVGVMAQEDADKAYIKEQRRKRKASYARSVL